MGNILKGVRTSETLNFYELFCFVRPGPKQKSRGLKTIYSMPIYPLAGVETDVSRCLWVYLYASIRLDASMHLHFHASMRVCVYASTRLCINVSMHLMSKRLCVYVSMCLCVYACMRLSVYASMCLRVHVSMPLFSLDRAGSIGSIHVGPHSTAGAQFFDKGEI